MFNLLEKCHNIRRDLCNGLKDEELNSLQVLFEHMGGHLNKTFVDLRKQEQLIDEMKLNLTNIRCKCIQMFRQIHYTNTHIRWLNRKIEAAWMLQFEKSKIEAQSHSEANVWNKVSSNKSTIENSIGKDAMLMAIRLENKRIQEENIGNEPKKLKEEKSVSLSPLLHSYFFQKCGHRCGHQK